MKGETTGVTFMKAMIEVIAHRAYLHSGLSSFDFVCELQFTLRRYDVNITPTPKTLPKGKMGL